MVYKISFFGAQGRYYEISNFWFQLSRKTAFCDLLQMNLFHSLSLHYIQIKTTK